MDAVIAKLIGTAVYEKFAVAPAHPAAPTKASMSWLDIVWLVVLLIILIAFGGWASMLSWDANTLVEWGTGLKVFFSFFAFLNGISYLIHYLIFKADLVNALRNRQ